MRRTVLLVTVMIAASGAANHSVAADECDGLKTPMSIMEGLGSTNPMVRARAESCGLASPDRTTRGLVIQKRLSGGNVFNISVENISGDAKGEEFLSMLPAFSARGVKWSADGRQFSGDGGYGSGTVQGTILGETLTISFTRVPIQRDPNRSGTIDSSCEASLSLTEKRDSLSGLLRCTGIPSRFRAWIGF